MRDLVLIAGAVLFGVAPLVGQSSSHHPDLEGLWSNETLTPLERPRELAGKEFFTEREAAAYEKHIVQTRIDDPNDGEGNVADPKVWWERAVKIVPDRRTSLIVDPPSGRVPALTPEAQKRMADQRTEARLHPADKATDRSLQERCILSPTTGPPMLPGPYNNNYQIVHTRDHVMITVEMIHEVRGLGLFSGIEFTAPKSFRLGISFEAFRKIAVDHAFPPDFPSACRWWGRAPARRGCWAPLTGSSAR